MFRVPIQSPGVTMNRIKQVDGTIDFCEEFFDDVELGDDAVVGEPGKGWEVASRQLYHERRTMGDGSEFTVGAGLEASQDLSVDFFRLLEMTDQADDESARRLAGRALAHRVVNQQLSEHVFHSVADGSLPLTAGAIARASLADSHNLDTDTALAIASTSSVVGDDEGLEIGVRYLGRQIINIGGGTTEMARNVIAERVLNFPREYAADRGVPFNQVRRNKQEGTRS
jgi:alkylation response protein AidB-like acyl-CoA dehydrogenase